MGADKIFVLILSLAFAAFIGYLMWRSRKDQPTGSPERPTELPTGEPEPELPPADGDSAAGKKARSRSRRK
jgi:hypothetical protein